MGARTVGGQGWAHSAYPRTGQRSCEPSREVCPKVARWSPPDALTSTCSAAAVVNTSSLILIGSPPSATPLRSLPANHASAARCGASGGPAQNSAHASSPSSPGDRRAVSRSRTHLRNSSRVRFEDPVSFSPASRTAWTTGEREDMSRSLRSLGRGAKVLDARVRSQTARTALAKCEPRADELLSSRRVVKQSAGWNSCLSYPQCESAARCDSATAESSLHHAPCTSFGARWACRTSQGTITTTRGRRPNAGTARSPWTTAM